MEKNAKKYNTSYSEVLVAESKWNTFKLGFRGKGKIVKQMFKNKYTNSLNPDQIGVLLKSNNIQKKDIVEIFRARPSI